MNKLKADSERPCSACSLPSRSLHSTVKEIATATGVHPNGQIVFFYEKEVKFCFSKIFQQRKETFIINQLSYIYYED